MSNAVTPHLKHQCPPPAVAVVFGILSCQPPCPHLPHSPSSLRPSHTTLSLILEHNAFSLPLPPRLAFAPALPSAGNALLVCFDISFESLQILPPFETQVVPFLSPLPILLDPPFGLVYLLWGSWTTKGLGADSHLLVHISGLALSNESSLGHGEH